MVTSHQSVAAYLDSLDSDRRATVAAVRANIFDAEPALTDDGGLLQWRSDIRATGMFTDVDDAAQQRDRLIPRLRRWLTLFPGPE